MNLSTKTNFSIFNETIERNGEILYRCKKCKGNGSIYVNIRNNEEFYFMACTKCKGKGYLNWIENCIIRK